VATVEKVITELTRLWSGLCSFFVQFTASNCIKAKAAIQHTDRLRF